MTELGLSAPPSTPSLPTPSSWPSPGPGKAFTGVSVGSHLPGLPSGSHWPPRPLQEHPSPLQPGQEAGSKGCPVVQCPGLPGWEGAAKPTHLRTKGLFLILALISSPCPWVLGNRGFQAPGWRQGGVCAGLSSLLTPEAIRNLPWDMVAMEMEDRSHLEGGCSSIATGRGFSPVQTWIHSYPPGCIKASHRLPQRPRASQAAWFPFFPLRTQFPGRNWVGRGSPQEGTQRPEH